MTAQTCVNCRYCSLIDDDEDKKYGLCYWANHHALPKWEDRVGRSFVAVEFDDRRICDTWESPDA